MKRHDLSLIERVKTDRALGLSIPELMVKYSLPKTTIWHHIRGVTMPEPKWLEIKARQGGSKIRHKHQLDKANKQAQKLLDKFDEEMCWPAILAALYWSEGTKKGGFVFTNTDDSMIQVFMKIMRDHLLVRDEELDILIRTCTPMDARKCRKHWSLITNIPYRNIRINHDNKHNKSKTIYGMSRMKLRKGSYFLQLTHCLIRGLTGKILLSRTLS